MVCLCWLLVVMIAFVFVPGFGSARMDTSICKELSSKQRVLDCIHLCMSINQTEYPELSALALKVNEGNNDNNDNNDGDEASDDDDDDDLLFSLLLASLASEDKIESNLKDNPDQQPSYATDRFRWGKLFENKLSESKLRAHGDNRRSYSMEHFRWGKPSGRPRRPVKIFASPLEGGFLPLVRRQLSSRDDDAAQMQAPTRVSSKPRPQSQERKDPTYRINHFRWGSPRTSKRNASFMRPWVKKTQGQLTKIFRDNVANGEEEHVPLSS